MRANRPPTGRKGATKTKPAYPGLYIKCAYTHFVGSSGCEVITKTNQPQIKLFTIHPLTILYRQMPLPPEI
jgi:hypothetical protein